MATDERDLEDSDESFQSESDEEEEPESKSKKFYNNPVISLYGLAYYKWYYTTVHKRQEKIKYPENKNL